MAEGLKTPTLTQVEFAAEDFDKAERLAKALGFEQTAYTSTSALWGLYCLPENQTNVGPWRRSKPPYAGGCIVKTRELGFLFVQTDEDIIGEQL